MKIYGKKRALEALGRFAASGRMPHALLLCGDEGTGRRTLADYIAMMYMCGSQTDGRPCMSCNTCRRIAEHIHPDAVDATAEVNRIYESMTPPKNHVKALRIFIADCSKMPNDGDVRVIIFEGLDNMTVLEQNTLLKCIEEPLEFNKYVFTASNKTLVLQTVLSRVVTLNVDDAGKADFTEAMADNGIAPGRADELYGLCGGNIGAALHLEESGGDIPYRAAAAKTADAVASGREYDCLEAMLALKTREEIFDALGVLSDIFAAAAAAKSGRPVTGAFAEQSGKIASRLGLKAITRLHGEAVKLYGLSFTNPNVKLFAAECCSRLFGAVDNRQEN